MSVDHYPSTYDCPIEEGGDPVLVCMESARKRLVTEHIRGIYISNSECCAVGAIAVADGHTRWSNKSIEEWLSATAIEAMALLDAVALERHPKSGDRSKWLENWHGRLEWVNEQWEPKVEPKVEIPTRAAIQAAVKVEILTIYDIAIKRRRAQYEIPQPPETWPIIEHEPEHEPVVPAELVIG